VLCAMFLGAAALIPDLGRRLLDSLVSPPVILMLTIASLSYAWVRNAVFRQL
jgi:hypothetical protein